MNEINISTKLSELRKEKGVTQEEVAMALEVSNKTVSKWESGSSAPDISMLAELAKYYNVSTDTLLGLAGERKGTRQVIANEFKGLDRQQTTYKIFELIKAIFPASYDAAGFDCDNVEEIIPPQTDEFPRYSIAVPELFSYAVCSDDVNIAVTQFRNKANFAWLLDEEKQKRIIELLGFVADADVIKIMSFIHSSNCSDSFTAEYMAKNAMVSLDKTTEVLEKSCNFGVCSKLTAHLVTGEVTVYASSGDGLILSIFSLAYVRMFGINGYNYNYYHNSKMIGAKKA